MDTKENKTYQPQGGRISQGSAQEPNTVPVGSASSSDYGQIAAVTPAAIPSMKIEKVLDGKETNSQILEEEELNRKESDEVKDNALEITIEIEKDNLSPEEIPQSTAEAETETASVTSGNTMMECEVSRHQKKEVILGGKTVVRRDSEEEILKRVSLKKTENI